MSCGCAQVPPNVVVPLRRLNQCAAHVAAIESKVSLVEQTVLLHSGRDAVLMVKWEGWAQNKQTPLDSLDTDGAEAEHDEARLQLTRTEQRFTAPQA